MEQVKPKTAQYLYHTYFSLVVKKGDEIIAEGNIHSCPEILTHLEDNTCSFFVRRNRKKRFISYLQGKIFIGFYLGLSFGLISGIIFSLMIFMPLKSSLIASPVLAITTLTSFVGFKISITCLHRLKKSYAKLKKNF